MSFLLVAACPAVSSAQSYRISHFVGGPGGGGFLDGPTASARFDRPLSAAVDSAGNVYIADGSSQIIRKISPAGVVTTLAGLPGACGTADGTGSAARFCLPQGLATDSAGDVYVADSLNNTIRKITPSGVVTTLAGSPGKSGSVDGTGGAALFDFPCGLATDSAGNIYVADTGNNNTIRKITPAGVVTTLAGSPTPGGGYADGTGSAARFNFDFSGAFAIDATGVIYALDSGNNAVRKVTAAGVVTTIAGGTPPTPCFSGIVDGIGSAACFLEPLGISLDSAGNLYVADGGTVIRKVTPVGVVTTIAGVANKTGFVDGTGPAAMFNGPTIIASDGTNLFVPEANNNAVRKVVIATAVVTTLAGGSPVFAGSTDGVGLAARFNFPTALATDRGNLYVADSGNSTIRQVSPTLQVTTLAGTPGVVGSADGIGSAASFGFSRVTAAPYSLATDGTNVYIPDSQNSTIRKLVIATGQVTTLAGTAGVPGSSDGIGAAARFQAPRGITTDGTNLYVVETGNSTIRQIVIATGAVTTLAGSAGVTGSTDGIGSAARFNLPTDITGDGANLYVVDRQNSTIRKIVIATRQVTTVAGVVSPPGSGFSDGIGSAARFNAPQGITTDGTNLYVTDGVIRVVVIATGQVTTVAGTPGWLGGMDGTGAGPLFRGPVGILFLPPPSSGASSFIFVADSLNNDIRLGACTADAPVSPAIVPVGNPTGPVTGIDFLTLTWSPPASGLTPNGYDWAINGDPFTATAGISVTAPPRNSNNPITLHVRGRACNPEVSGTAEDSPTYSPVPPVASFTASVSGLSVTVTDTSKPQATSWLWLWGDGTFDTVQAPPAHTYSVSGNYPIVLIATNGAGSSSSIQRAQTLAISVPVRVKALLAFDALNPERRRLGGITIARQESIWLRIAPVGDEDITVYLRFLDAAGNLVEERRLAPAAGTESVYDLGAYGLRGTYTLELVANHGPEATLVETTPDHRGVRGDDDGDQ